MLLLLSFAMGVHMFYTQLLVLEESKYEHGSPGTYRHPWLTLYNSITNRWMKNTVVEQTNWQNAGSGSRSERDKKMN